MRGGLKQGGKIAELNGYRRIFVNGSYPYILPDPESSVKGVLFETTMGQIWEYDDTEGTRFDEDGNCDEEHSLYIRKKVQVEDKEAWVYIPSTKTIEDSGLSIELDTHDLWKYNVLYRLLRDELIEFKDLF